MSYITLILNCKTVTLLDDLKFLTIGENALILDGRPQTKSHTKREVSLYLFVFQSLQ